LSLRNSVTYFMDGPILYLPK